MRIENLSQKVKDEVKQLLESAPADQKADAIMQSIEMINEAENVLDSTPMGNRTAEWYYLKGMCAYHRGWSEQAFDYITTACNMDSNNTEYRAALNNMRRERSYNYGGYNTTNMGSSASCSCCDICAGMMCANCLCNCCGSGC